MDMAHTDTLMVQKPHEELRRFVRILFGRKVAMAGAIVIILFICMAVFAPVISPHKPDALDLAHSFEKPSRDFFLGTDQFGRDVLSRLIYGSRVSLAVALISVGIACVIGIVLGLIAGYFSGWPNAIIMRFIDGLMSIPSIVLAIALVGILGQGLFNVMLAIGIALMPTYCRLMCGQVLSVKQEDYVLATHVLGASHLRAMFLHIVPNCFPPLIVQITLNFGVAILLEAGLSFLGLGISPPTAAWGSMIQDGYQHLLDIPLLSVLPGLCIMVVVLSFNLAGDGIRDALDPRLRGTL
jgi:ABC-type dipeptide/oligopeptide/nickel transport system permease subunit